MTRLDRMCFLLVLLGFAANAVATPPHIVVFLVDDLGWQDTSVPMTAEPTPLNRRFRTPGMERLAAEGMVWTDASATPICSPSRISMITGMNAARHRVTSWTLHEGRGNDQPHPRLRMPEWNVNGLSPDPSVPRAAHARALPAVLRDAGYHTIHVGKAHLGAIGTPAADPRAVGFDVNIAGHAAGAPGSHLGVHHFAAGRRTGSPDRPSVWDVPGLESYHGQDITLAEALTREAVAALRRGVTEGGPVFLHLSHYLVHTPIMADPRCIDRYAGLEPVEAAYASMVEAMDRSLGEVLDELDRLGIAGHTLVVFISDNGGLSALGRGGPRDTHNRPLSAGKGSAREGGNRVPMLVRWPGVVPPGSRTDQPLIVEDLFPTLLEAAGVDAAAADLPQVVDGRSMLPVLRDPAVHLEPAALLWHLPNHWAATGPGYGPASWIRLGRWKLIQYHDPAHEPRVELFDLAADLGEQVNRAREQPAIARRLAAMLTARLQEVDAQRPVRIDTGEPVAWPDAALEAWLATATGQGSAEPGP